MASWLRYVHWLWLLPTHLTFLLTLLQHLAGSLTTVWVRWQLRVNVAAQHECEFVENYKALKAGLQALGVPKVRFRTSLE
jgi:hypothetical protein